MQRAVPRRHHLRRHQSEQSHGKAAKRRTQRRPEPGLREQHLAQRHAAHDGDAKQRRQDSEQRGNGEITSQDVADRTDADAERQHRESMGDDIAGDRGNADRRQACRSIATDHQLKGIEGTGERRAKGARNRRRGTAADHDALIGAAQMKPAAQRGGEPAGELGVSCFEPDRGADTARPDGLQRHDHAAAKRHPPAMQCIGLDRIDFARRPPSQQQQEGHAQQQSAEARNQQRAQRLDPELARQTLPHFEVEQQHVEPLDRGAHRGHHQTADGSDQQRQQDQA